MAAARAQQAAPPAPGGNMPSSATLKRVRTKTLEIAYEDSGPQAGTPVLLMHGFPYDPRAYDGVVPLLVAAGCRAIVPYLRGYGPTRFLSADTPRSGQQGAIGHDLLELMDALALPKSALVGFDWGGRAACVAAALWPERVLCLVSTGGYNIQNIAASVQPRPPQQEHRAWYQYYFHTERGRAGLTKNRRDVCRFLWKLWSPEWAFDEATFEKSAVSFDNPDFVDVVIQSYRHRFGYAPGDPALATIDANLARQPKIAAPTINLHGGHDGISVVAEKDGQAKFFTAAYERRVLPRIGHNVPQEAPNETVAAMRDLMKGTSQ
jgi:pimeloyl-ACP methyl ester carboxylesterase